MPDLDLALLSDLPKDTGWRNIAELLHPAWKLSDLEGFFQIRRVGDRVYLRFRVTSVETSQADLLLLGLPAGFQAEKRYLDLGLFKTYGSTNPRMVSVHNMWGSGSIRVGPADTAGMYTLVQVAAEVSWDCVQPWPATLPGTAA